MSTTNLQTRDQQSHQPENQLWTVKDVAAFLKCSLRHVGNLQRAGLPFIKLGHLTRFDPASLKRWMQLG